MSKVLIGVTGGIAAYKVPAIARLLIKSGHSVRFMMTDEALKFIGTVTLEAISNNTVFNSHNQEGHIGHIELAKWADICLVAPATANTIGKYASGIADSPFLSVLLALNIPLVFAPAMNTNMFLSKPVQENLVKLKNWGIHIIEPEEGVLACGDTGTGKLKDPEKIVEELEYIISNNSMADTIICKTETVDIIQEPVLPCHDGNSENVKKLVDDFNNRSVEEYLSHDQCDDDTVDEAGNNNLLEGIKVLVTAGPTREYIDPVRYITNRSSGKMGYAIAEVAYEMGADVILVSGDVSLDSKLPNVVRTVTSAQMAAAVMSHVENCDIIVMAAAVADYRPKDVATEKIKKNDDTMQLELEKTTDILREIGKVKSDKQVLVGFAAETQDLQSNAKKKLAEKNLDIIVANDVSRSDIGFDSDFNEAILFFKDGAFTETGKRHKKDIAKIIITESAIIAGKLKED